MKKITAVVCLLLCTVCLAAAEGTLGGYVSVAVTTAPAGQLRGGVSYAVPCLAGDGSNPLTAGNNLKAAVDVDVTPITAGADFSATLTPLALMNIKAGVYTGSGWNLMGADGVAADGAFTPLYYKPYVESTVQMDFGIFMPGDWTHIVTQWTYGACYENLAGLPAGAAFTWQGGETSANPGWYATGLVGYSLPAVPVLDTVGTMLNWKGKYGMKGAELEINGVLQLSLSGTDSVACQASFDSVAGYKSVAVQYTHNF